MDDTKFNVTLTGPAKVDGQWRKPGDSVSVTRTVVEHLLSSSSIALLPETELGFIEGDSDAFEKAVAAKAEQLAAQCLDTAVSAALVVATAEVQTAADARITDIEKDAAARIAQAEKEAVEKIVSAEKLTETRILEAQETARKASVENIGSIVAWLKVEANALAVLDLTEDKVAKAISKALDRVVTLDEIKTASVALDLSKQA